MHFKRVKDKGVEVMQSDRLRNSDFKKVKHTRKVEMKVSDLL